MIKRCDSCVFGGRRRGFFFAVGFLLLIWVWRVPHTFYCALSVLFISLGIFFPVPPFVDVVSFFSASQFDLMLIYLAFLPLRDLSLSCLIGALVDLDVAFSFPLVFFFLNIRGRSVATTVDEGSIEGVVMQQCMNHSSGSFSPSIYTFPGPVSPLRHQIMCACTYISIRSLHKHFPFVCLVFCIVGMHGIVCRHIGGGWYKSVALIDRS